MTQEEIKNALKSFVSSKANFPAKYNEFLDGLGKIGDKGMRWKTGYGTIEYFPLARIEASDGHRLLAWNAIATGKSNGKLEVVPGAAYYGKNYDKNSTVAFDLKAVQKEGESFDVLAKRALEEFVNHEKFGKLLAAVKGASGENKTGETLSTESFKDALMKSLREKAELNQKGLLNEEYENNNLIQFNTDVEKTVSFDSLKFHVFTQLDKVNIAKGKTVKPSLKDKEMAFDAALDNFSNSISDKNAIDCKTANNIIKVSLDKIISQELAKKRALNSEPVSEKSEGKSCERWDEEDDELKESHSVNEDESWSDKKEAVLKIIKNKFKCSNFEARMWYDKAQIGWNYAEPDVGKLRDEILDMWEEGQPSAFKDEGKAEAVAKAFSHVYNEDVNESGSFMERIKDLEKKISDALSLRKHEARHFANLANIAWHGSPSTVKEFENAILTLMDDREKNEIVARKVARLYLETMDCGTLKENENVNEISNIPLDDRISHYSANGIIEFLKKHGFKLKSKDGSDDPTKKEYCVKYDFGDFVLANHINLGKYSIRGNEFPITGKTVGDLIKFCEKNEGKPLEYANEEFNFRKQGGPDAQTVLANMILSLGERYRFAKNMTVNEKCDLCVKELYAMGLKNMQYSNLNEAAIDAKAWAKFDLREQEYMSKIYSPKLNLREALAEAGIVLESSGPQKGDKRLESLKDYDESDIEAQKNKNAVYLNKLNGILKAKIDQKAEAVGEDFVWSFFAEGMNVPILTIAFKLNNGLLSWKATMNGREISSGELKTTEWNVAKDMDSALKKVLEGLEVGNPVEDISKKFGLERHEFGKPTNESVSLETLLDRAKEKRKGDRESKYSNSREWFEHTYKNMSNEDLVREWVRQLSGLWLGRFSDTESVMQARGLKKANGDLTDSGEELVKAELAKPDKLVGRVAKSCR